MEAATVPHNRPLVTDADRAAVDRVLSSSMLAGGPEVPALEAAFDDRLGGGGSCATSSGTAALYLALTSLGVGSSDVVALPTYSCTALLNAVHFAGAQPLVVDVVPDRLTLDPVALEAAVGRLGRSPAATIAVHCFGAVADLGDLGAQGPLVEDCCQALGGRLHDGTMLGSRHTSVFSFYATKVITSGHGGLVHDPSGVVAGRARDLREYDLRETYEPRFNFLLSDFQAAMARSQLDRIDEIAARRRAIAHRYLEVLPGDLTTDPSLTDAGRMAFRFVVEASDAARRDELRAHFGAHGISTIVPVERFELLHRYLGLDPAHFRVSERVVDVTLSLPVFPGMTDDEVDRVCAALASAR